MCFIQNIQTGRNTELSNFLRKKSYIDMDYVYGVLSNSDGENPLDYPAIAASSMELITVATNALTGEAKYFDKSDIAQDNYDVVKASCSIPLVCHPYIVNGVPYYDGALSDPIPVEKAFTMGCDKVVLILTRQNGFQAGAGKGSDDRQRNPQKISKGGSKDGTAGRAL